MAAVEGIRLVMDQNFHQNGVDGDAVETHAKSGCPSGWAGFDFMSFEFEVPKCMILTVSYWSALVRLAKAVASS